jgi:hypothetical protein
VAVWRELYFDKPASTIKSSKSVPKFHFRVGQTVRIAHTRRVFSKDTHHRWTIELFLVMHRSRFQNIPIYRLKDQMNEAIEGYFYTNELQSVRKNELSEYHIERVIKKIRNPDGQYSYLIRWRGWPSKFDSIVLAKDMRSIDMTDDITATGGKRIDRSKKTAVKKSN